MKTIEEINILFAEFLEWEKVEYIQHITNPKHPLFRKVKPKPEMVFCLEEEHPIVQKIYTDVPGYTWNYDLEDENENPISRLLFFNKDLKFHDDYNWLNLVIDKIETLGFVVNISRPNCTILDEFGRVIMTKHITDSKMNAVYETLYEFINSSKKI